MLRIENVSVSFGGIKAVDGVSLELDANEVLGLVGPNGSGKSTLLNAVCGLVPSSGAITFDGTNLRRARSVGVRRAGVLRTFQTPQLVPGLTCLENVMLADRDRSLRGLTAATIGRPVMLGRERQRWARGLAALDRVGLAGTASLPAGSLPYGRGRLLELARIIAGGPKVVLLDEPSAGLNESETEEFGDLLKTLAADGVALLIVDHKIDFLDRLCDRLVVLELGRVIATGSPAEVWSDERVIDAYLGVADAHH